MAEFTADLQSFRPLFPFLDIDSMELIHQFKTVNSLHVMDNSYFNHMQNLMPFSNSSNNIFGSPEESQFPGTLEENFSVPVSFPISSNDTLEDKKRKATTMDMNETTSVNSTPAVSENRERVSETRDYASQGYGGVSSFQPTWL
ncbi:hypothetical protein RIF29_34969 [Crotalaria pallida]|uniref:Uncharacterized protein n=1 Tax=Crotalaria pallida TaxID=3830 RepID=A0AAN9E9W0_CROPI